MHGNFIITRYIHCDGCDATLTNYVIHWCATGEKQRHIHIYSSEYSDVRRMYGLYMQGIMLSMLAGGVSLSLRTLMHSHWLTVLFGLCFP